MSTNDDRDQSPTDPILHSSDVRKRVREHIHQRAGPAKSWFKARFVSRRIDEEPNRVGNALAAMYYDEDCELVVERRPGTSSYVYRVEVDDG